MDIFRRWRRCPFCKGKENLSMVTEHGWEWSINHYYHPECIRRILSSGIVSDQSDMAVRITKAIGQELERTDRKLRDIEAAWRIVQELDNRIRRPDRSETPAQAISTIQTLTEGA